MGRCPRADPRKRGGTLAELPEPVLIVGRSPQARGNLSRKLDPLVLDGPIPASAGEPAGAREQGQAQRADPRKRGGTTCQNGPRYEHSGRSPQARGNPSPDRPPAPGRGPIPASAGEPSQGNGAWSNEAADPRKRGGTRPAKPHGGAEKGRSPQARGNPICRTDRRRSEGPIPASAGEPSLGADSASPALADPRKRGGTKTCHVCNTSVVGRSPQARGNRTVAQALPLSAGPIPASAGEPPGRQTRHALSKADPPQARGNRTKSHTLSELMGPIPASAGEPPGCRFGAR